MRVSDNTSRAAAGEAIRRTRSRMEDLQIKNASQKRITSAADDPAGHSKIMDIRTQASVNQQFDSNASLAKNRLTMTDVALGEVYDLFVRAKEIAISQSSEASANADSRIGVAQEVSQLYKQLVSAANRRSGQHYLFGGYKTLESPYSFDGNYSGDEGEMKVEVQKDVFIPINMPGNQIFELKRFKQEDKFKDSIVGQELIASEKINFFHELDALKTGLLTNDTITIRDGLEKLDNIINHVITMRTKLSARVSGIDNALGQTSKIDQANTELMSKLEDADYAQLWSDLSREETVLRSSLQAAQKLVQPTLLDFLK